MNSLQATLIADLKTAQLETSRAVADNTRLQQEVEALCHHRGVLRESMERLEKELRSKVDALAEALYQIQQGHDGGSLLGLHHMELGPMGGSSASVATELRGVFNRERTLDEEESLRRQLARFRAKSLAMEELVAIYRSGVLALYADGASYGAAQFGWQQHAQAQDGLGVGWIEREMGLVKRSYDDEIRLLEAEVNELRGKLRQSGSYISELRKRFEENMKAMYR